MKKVFLFVVCAVSFAVASAQVSFGIKGGANLANLSGEDVEDNKAKIGFHVGGLVQIPVATSFSVQPELYYSDQGAKFEEEGDDYNLNLGYLNVPVLAKYTSTSGFYGQTGPQLGFLMSAKVKADGEKVDVKDSFKSTDFSWVFGLGYQTSSNVGIDLRYNLGLGNIADSDDAKVKNSVFQLGVYYVFGSSK